MASSAYINTPPANHRDYMIAKGMLLNAGITSDIRDPSKGVKLSPLRPDDYSFETKGPAIIAGLSVCIAAMTIITCVRLGLRWFVPRLKWGLDDTLIIPGMLMAVAYPALQLAMVRYGGAGKHIFDVTYEEYYHYKWLANIAQIDFFVCVGVIKMSITAFNIRLTSLSSRTWQIVNWTFFTICGLYTLTAFFLNIFQCNPAGGSFDLLILARSGKPPKCVGVAHMGTILRAINIALDYCLLAVPASVLWKAQMTWVMKGRLFVMFGVGGLACVGSVMTLVSKFHLKTDLLWNYTGILGWSLVELALGILAASLPTLAFLLPNSMKSTNAKYASGGHVRVSHTGGSAFDPKRQVNTTTSFRSAGDKEYVTGPDGAIIARTSEVLPERRPSSDLESQETATSMYDLTKDERHSSWFIEDGRDGNELPIMGVKSPITRNFSRPGSRGRL